MRRRVVIGVVAVLVGGGIAAWVWRPWESPVEYHKRKYLAVQRGPPIWICSLRDVVRRATRQPPAFGYSEKKYEEMAKHRKALLKLGYLQERAITVSNIHPGSAIFLAASHADLKTELAYFDTPETNVLVVVAPREDIPRWEKAVGEVDENATR